MTPATKSPEELGANRKTLFEADIAPLTRGQAAEIVWPYALAAIGGLAVYFCAKKFSIPAQIKDVFAAVTGTAATIAGFMLAAAAILASIGDRPFIRQARRAGVYAKLIHFLFVSMRWSIYTAAVSIPAILFDPIWRFSWYPIALGAWGFVTLTALLSSIRALQMFTKVMRYVSDD